jgi:hypothetical protein
VKAIGIDMNHGHGICKKMPKIDELGFINIPLNNLNDLKLSYTNIKDMHL